MSSASQVTRAGINGKFRDRRWLLSLLVLTVVGLAVRLVANKEALAADELILAGHINGVSFGNMVSRVVEIEKTPPLGFVLSWIASRVGDAPEWIRLPSLISGTLLVPAISELGRRVGGRPVGLASGLLAVVSPILVFYSVEARSYSLTALFCVGATIGVIAGRGSPKWAIWLLVGLLEALALMTHYVALGVVVVLALWAIRYCQGARRKVLAAQLLPIFALLIWSPWALTQFHHSGRELQGIAKIQGSKLDALAEIPIRLIAGAPTAQPSQVPGLVAGLLIGTGLIILTFALAIRAARTGWRPRLRPDFVLLGCIALVTSVVMVVVSMQPGKSMLLVRNVTPSLPAILVFLGVAIVAARRTAGLLALSLLVLGMSVATYQTLTRYSRPPADEVAAAIQERWTPNSAIVNACCWKLNGPPGEMLRVHLGKKQRASLEVLRLNRDFPILVRLLANSHDKVFMVYDGFKTGDRRDYFDALFPTGKRVWSAEFHGYTIIYAAEYDMARSSESKR